MSHPVKTLLSFNLPLALPTDKDNQELRALAHNCRTKVLVNEGQLRLAKANSN
jgi:hypothetical protein